jgi:hypothetical protein
MKCPKCKKKLKKENITISEGKYEGKEYFELQFSCDKCEDETAFTRIKQEDLVELD